MSKRLELRRPGEFATWLAGHGTIESEVWLVLYKKESGKQAVSYRDTLEDALCHGWIDSRVRSLDAERFTVRFTPRRSRNWSDPNLALARRLLAEGRMTEHGLAVLPEAFRQ